MQPKMTVVSGLTSGNVHVLQAVESRHSVFDVPEDFVESMLLQILFNLSSEIDIRLLVLVTLAKNYSYCNDQRYCPRW